MLELVLSVYRRMLLSEIIRIQTSKRSLQYQQFSKTAFDIHSGITLVLRWWYVHHFNSTRSSVLYCNYVISEHDSLTLNPTFHSTKPYNPPFLIKLTFSFPGASISADILLILKCKVWDVHTGCYNFFTKRWLLHLLISSKQNF